MARWWVGRQIFKLWCKLWDVEPASSSSLSINLSSCPSGSLFSCEVMSQHWNKLKTSTTARTWLKSLNVSFIVYLKIAVCNCQQKLWKIFGEGKRGYWPGEGVGHLIPAGSHCRRHVGDKGGAAGGNLLQSGGHALGGQAGRLGEKLCHAVGQPVLLGLDDLVKQEGIEL